MLVRGVFVGSVRQLVLLAVLCAVLVIAVPGLAFAVGPDISVNAASLTVNYKDVVTVSGTLAGYSTVEVPRVVVSTSPDGSTWTQLVELPVTTEGTFSFESARLTQHTYFRFSYTDADTSTTVTADTRVRVRAWVGTPKAPTAVYKGVSTTVTGYLKPQHKSGTSPVRIYLYRKTSSGSWSRYGYVSAKVTDYDAFSRYSTSVRLPYRGEWRLKAYHVADSQHLGTWSAPLDIRAVGTKLVALTFDDGPVENGTPQVLKALRKYNAKATFFMLGHRVNKRPDLVRAIARDGHQLGNHRYTHKVRSTEMPIAEFRDEVERTNRGIARALKGDPSGKVPHRYPIAFRYPWGIGNSRTEAVLDDLGMRSWRWSYGPGDGGPQGSYSVYVRDLIANKVLSNTKPNSIILLHDAPDQPNTVAAVPIILRSLASQGYDFVTIEELRQLR